jgi:two-component system LytT family response regulator
MAFSNQMKNGEFLRAYLVDDELLALKRLAKLLEATNLVEIIGRTTDPQTAVSFLSSESVDVLFLDIQMPGMNGFELLTKLPKQPMVIFTTAYDKYALKAFEVNSIDYLLKPIEPLQLDRALNKIAQFRAAAKSLAEHDQFQSLLLKLAEKFSRPAPNEFPNRISSRIGDRILFIDLDKITHFFSEDKLTFAATTEDKKYIVDYTITELERKLNSMDFCRIHRATLVNLRFVNELHRWFGGRMIIRMKDKNQTQLTVARDKTAVLKERLGL